jgi:hypothetical protein
MRRIIDKFLIACCALALTSCGGGGGGGGGGVSNVASDPATGEVALLITDAPTAEFDEINLTIIEAELMSDSGRVTVFSGEKEFDLLELTEVTEVFAVSDAPAGEYNKVRLTLSQIELVFKDNRDPEYPKLPGNGKLDLNPRGTFYVDPDKPLVIQLDIDAEKSILVVGAGDSGKYIFRPVVFVDIAEGEFDTKLVRQRGTVNDIDLDDGTFRLCLIEAEIQPVPATDDDSPDCVIVDTTTAPASIFDDFAEPMDLEDLEIGDIVTVVGRFAFDDDDSSSEPADEGRLVLVAEVIWRGDDITRTNNIACTDVREDGDRGRWYESRELPLPVGDDCSDGESRPTILQPGARIYDAEGNRLTQASITEDTLNQVDGYLDTGEDPEELKAVLVMLRGEESADDSVQLTGTISDIDSGDSLILMTDDGDRCVNFSAAGTEVFETGLDEDNNVIFDQQDVDALRVGQKANAFGEEHSDGCLNANTIIYEAEE